MIFNPERILSLREMVELICGDDLLRKAAATSVKREIDWIYGYSKYDLGEVMAYLGDRLYSMTYLADAVVGIISHKRVSVEVKKRLAQSYLHLLKPYTEDKLPKAVYEFWGMEPNYTLEMAVFLDGIGELDWLNHELLGLIMTFGRESDAESKEGFLKLLVEHLNQVEGLADYITTSLTTSLSLEESLLQLVHEKAPNAILLTTLSLTISHRTKHVSLKPLGKLERLTPNDVVWLMNGLDLFQIRNRVKSCEELYEILVEMGVSLKDLLSHLISEMKGRFKYSHEPRVKGLLNVIAKQPGDKEELVDLSTKLLDMRLSAVARLSIYKFIYKETGGEGVLKRAEEDPAKMVRDWVASLV